MKSLTVGGVTFEQKQRGSYFWFGEAHDACLEGKKNNYRLNLHAKDGTIIQSLTGYTPELIITKAVELGYFSEQEVD